MAETQPATSRRARHLERLRKKYPDRKFEDDEEIFGAISDDYDQFEQENSAMKSREKAMSDMFRADPRSAFLLNDMREGKDPVMGLIRRFGKEIKDILDDPAMQDRIEEEHKAYMERVTKSRRLDEEYDRNMDKTLQTLSDWQRQNGLSDEEIDSIGAAWLQMIREGVMGILSTETITLIANALNHDADVDFARSEGETAGRNKKVVEHFRRSRKGDGIAYLNGRNGAPGQAAGDRPKSIFDLAREAE